MHEQCLFQLSGRAGRKQARVWMLASPVYGEDGELRMFKQRGGAQMEVQPIETKV